jgi:hypothetical protein
VDPPPLVERYAAGDERDRHVGPGDVHTWFRVEG